MKFLIASAFLFVLFFQIHKVYAESPYILPYPSAMPGSLYYKINLAKEKIMQHWYFGDFGQFSYNLRYSDKYLVEAKTLFEYKQYNLGYHALQKSNMYFSKTSIFLTSAKRNKKDIILKTEVLKSAAQKHIEVLRDLQPQLPQTFLWQDETKPQVELPLSSLIEQSVRLRNSCL